MDFKYKIIHLNLQLVNNLHQDVSEQFHPKEFLEIWPFSNLPFTMVVNQKLSLEAHINNQKILSEK